MTRVAAGLMTTKRAGQRVTYGDLSQDAAGGCIDARHAAGQTIGNPDG
jgi:hypothetical protein